MFDRLTQRAYAEQLSKILGKQSGVRVDSAGRAAIILEYK